jgi:hypothetical protein
VLCLIIIIKICINKARKKLTLFFPAIVWDKFRMKYNYIASISLKIKKKWNIMQMSSLILKKVPKCEIFDRSDFYYFYTIKPFWVDDFVVKILNYYFNFWGSQASFIFWCAAEQVSIRVKSWCVYSVPYAHAQCTHQFLTRTLSMCISSWWVCSTNASVPDPYAQGTHQSLPDAYSQQSACFEGTALLSIRLSICVRIFAARNEPRNIFF